MTPTDRRKLWVGGGALALAGLTAVLQPRREAPGLGGRSLADLVPVTIAGRTSVGAGDAMPETPEGAFEAAQTIARDYGGVTLLVAYHPSRTTDLKVHRPEVCYRVAGFQLTPTDLENLTLPHSRVVPCASFVARRAERTESVLYWTRLASAFPQTLSAERSALIQQAFAGLRSDGLLVRFSVDGDDLRTNGRLLRAFARALVQESSPAGRMFLLGDASNSGARVGGYDHA